jgi:hypothetical protein
MVAYGGLIFYEANEYSFLRKGVTLGKVFTSNPQPGSPLAIIYNYIIEKLGKYSITNLNSLIEAIPNLINQGKFIATVKFLGTLEECDLVLSDLCTTADHQTVNYITLNKYDSDYLVFSFNQTTMSWYKDELDFSGSYHDNTIIIS